METIRTHVRNPAIKASIKLRIIQSFHPFSELPLRHIVIWIYEKHRSIPRSQFPSLVQNGRYSPTGQSRLNCANARFKKTTLGSAGGWLLSRLRVLAQDGARRISWRTRYQINVPGEHRMLAKVWVRVFVFRCLEVAAMNAERWWRGLWLDVFHLVC